MLGCPLGGQSSCGFRMTRWWWLNMCHTGQLRESTAVNNSKSCPFLILFLAHWPTLSIPYKFSRTVRTIFHNKPSFVHCIAYTHTKARLFAKFNKIHNYSFYFHTYFSDYCSLKPIWPRRAFTTFPQFLKPSRELKAHPPLLHASCKFYSAHFMCTWVCCTRYGDSDYCRWKVSICCNWKIVYLHIIACN